MNADAVAERPDDVTVRPEGASGRPAPPTYVHDGTAWRVRPAEPGDTAAVFELVCELASYEREADAVRSSSQDLRTALFNPHPRVFCHVVEADGPAGASLVGMAIWFVSYSTWTGRHGLWLEDLYVRPDVRRLGAGRALLAKLAGICADRGYARMEWSVLDWNEPAHRFYRSIGAEPMDDWTTWRVTDEALDGMTERTK